MRALVGVGDLGGACARGCSRSRAGRVVLRQPGDLLEQLAAARRRRTTSAAAPSASRSARRATSVAQRRGEVRRAVEVVVSMVGSWRSPFVRVGQSAVCGRRRRGVDGVRRAPVGQLAASRGRRRAARRRRAMPSRPRRGRRACRRHASRRPASPSVASRLSRPPPCGERPSRDSVGEPVGQRRPGLPARRRRRPNSSAESTADAGVAAASAACASSALRAVGAVVRAAPLWLNSQRPCVNGAAAGLVDRERRRWPTAPRPARRPLDDRRRQRRERGVGPDRLGPAVAHGLARAVDVPADAEAVGVDRAVPLLARRLGLLVAGECGGSSTSAASVRGSPS